MLTQDEIDFAVCEWHEDYVVAYTDGTVKLVSVKHREEDQGPWTVPELCINGGLAHLYDRWRACNSDPKITLKLETNAALSPRKGNAAELRRICGPDLRLTDATADLVNEVSLQLLKARWKHPYENIPETKKERKKASIKLPDGFTDSVANFLRVLEISTDPPQRRDITADNIQNLLEPAAHHLPDVAPWDLDLRATYDAIVNRIEKANRSEENRVQLAAYIARTTPARHNEQLDDQITRRKLDREIILENFKYKSATAHAPQLQHSERIAVHGYRRTLNQGAGYVKFSLLADNIPPMLYPALSDNICASFESEEMRRRDSPIPLNRAARRLQRMILCGLPGTGKTIAVEQLAASWAGDDSAPLPIVVNLRRASIKLDKSQPLTLSNLLSDAALLIDPDSQKTLISALGREVAAGNAMLIIDGLDECQSRAATIADDIKNIIDELDPKIGVMVTTRPSAIGAAEKLELPILTLAPPSGMNQFSIALLHHIGTARISDESERAIWADRCRSHLQVARSQHGDLFKIPLMANLLTLLVASTQATSMPSSRAELLEFAVKESVARWERGRNAGMLDEYDGHGVLDVDVLLDGFVTIGHELSLLLDRTAHDVAAALSQFLQHEWNKGRREADALAQKIFEFWDQKVGVFVTQQDGSVAARSRVFVEIADSMWIASQKDEQIRQAWVADVLSDESKSDTFRLAVSKMPTLVDFAVEKTDEIQPRKRLLRWVSDIGAELPREHLSFKVLKTVLSELSTQIAHEVSLPPDSSDAAGDDPWSLAGRRRAIEGPKWPLVLRVASLLLPAALRRERDETLSQYTGNPENMVTAAALAALADASYDERPLTPAELDQVQAALRLPLPATPQTMKPSRGRFRLTETTDPLLSGRDDVAERALLFFEQLESDVVDAIELTSRKTSLKQARRIEDGLIRQGRVPAKDLLAPFQPDFDRLKDSDGQWWSTKFLRALGTIEPPAETSPAERWWCTDLFDLVQLLRAAHIPLDEFREALDTNHRDDTVTLARIYAFLNGVNLEKVADQIQTLTDDELDSLGDIAFLDHPHRHPNTARLAKEAVYFAAALRIVCSSCNWHAALACDLLVGLKDEQSAAELVSRIADLPPSSRYWMAVAACVLTTDLSNTAKQLIEHDFETRRGVAAVVVSLAEDSAGTNSVVRSLRNDRDLSVRILAGGTEQGPPRAEVWTCRSCKNENLIDDEDCISCTRGSKPAPAQP